MKGHATHFFASGNTARGFTSLYETSLQDLNRLYVLQGGLSSLRSSIIRSIGETMAAKGYNTWLIHCSADNSLLDGLILPQLKVGIVDGTAPRTIQTDLPEGSLHQINLNDIVNDPNVLDNQPDLLTLKTDMAKAYESAYAGFAEALRVHDDWEELYISNMDFQAANQLTSDLLQILYGDDKLEKKSRVDHRFLGAATPEGAVDFVPNLTNGLKRYLIKGRPGSGKSTMLKKIASTGVEYGYDVEIYHCGFDPNSIDMIIVRELGFAIFDSTAPHEYFPNPNWPADEIVDMYERCITPGTDELHQEAISRLQVQYSSKMKEAISLLAKAKAHQGEIDQLLTPLIDETQIESIRDNLKQEILEVSAVS